MKQFENVTLIEDTFVNEQTKDMLFKMFKEVIDFYKIKNLISHVRYGREDNYARSKITELTNQMENFQHLLVDASQGNSPVKIHSELQILSR